MPSQPVRRVGIIGAGWVTSFHLPAWTKQRNRAEVVAIADPAAAARDARAAEFGIPRTYASAAEMLASEALDVVDIASPRETHAEMVRLAAGKSVDILCQKPLGVDLAEAERTVASVPPQSRMMVHENWRFRAHYRLLKRWIEEGRLGVLRQASFEFFSSGMIGPGGQRPAVLRQPFFAKQKRLLVMEVLIHHLDTLRFLFGEFDVVSAQLERTNDDIVAEDVAAVVLRRQSDGMLLPILGNLAVHGEPHVPRDRLRLFGADATIELLGGRLGLTGPEPLQEEFTPDQIYQGSYDAAIAHFLDRLETGAPFETSPEDNLRTMALVEAIYHLARFDPASKPR